MNKIVFDVMSGDFGPEGPIFAAKKFANEFPETNLILVGSKEAFDKFGKEFPTNIELVYSTEIISMEDSNPLVYRKKRNSSLSLALNKLKEGAAGAMLSCANTGAYLTAAFLQSKPISKSIRPPLVGMVNSLTGDKVILDLGSVVDCEAKNLVDFAIIGSIYHSVINNSKNPEVVLIQNGTEDHKGNKVSKEAFKLFKEDSRINFIGNIEAKTLFTSNADVFVVEGFSGNHILKTAEASMKYVGTVLKNKVTKNPFRKIGALILKNAFKEMKDDLASASKNGGAVMLGLNHIIVKSPGSSNAETVYNGLKLTKKMIDNDIVNKIKKELL